MGGIHRGAGAAEVIAVEADQRYHAVRHGHVEGFADLAGQLQARLELGQRVVPFPGDETFHAQEHPETRQRPADPELLADPPARVQD